jgi:16S rRNA (cytosine967-C5)-methyltransferase
MKPAARVQAALEILQDLDQRRRPAADAVKDWMLAHRFAGARDRGSIGDMVFGALRWKASSAWRMDAHTPRAWLLGALRWGFGWPEAAFAWESVPHAPETLSPGEHAHLRGETIQSRLEGAPAWVRGDYPDWLAQQWEAAFGEAGPVEGAALAAPAPLDLRANTLKSDRDAVIAALNDSPRLLQAPGPTPFSPDGIRIPWQEGRSFAWATQPAFLKGWFEVQDEGSQLSAAWAGVMPGMQIADVCAGGGGKTLALAAATKNSGQVYAFDIDGARLAPLKARLDRAGVRNAQIRYPSRSGRELADLAGKLDVVVVDAPCTGSGVWRRNPDSKWRLRPGALDIRVEEQQAALALGAPLVKPGGKLVYITCSVLPAENESAVARFLESQPGFVADQFPAPIPGLESALQRRALGVQMTPRLTGCDGFYVCCLRRAG